MPIIPAIPIFILTALVVVALFAPLIAPYSPVKGKLPDSLHPPAWIEGGSWDHPLGTDRLGRDTLSRLIYGSRLSLLVGVLAVFFAGTIGTTVGLISGYFGGYVDAFLMRVTAVVLSLPLILMALILAVVLGASFTNVILVIVVLLWPRYARQIRGETLSIKEQDFVALARIAGCSSFRIMWRHIFPNVVPTLLVLATLQVGYVIILESTLSFLGVGIPPPMPSWGVMVSDGRVLMATAWWLPVFPGLAILLVVLSANLLGDWIRDKLDPKLRQV
ncbi:MAG: ABC transporter permease [Anaerolineales bacterium]|nr:ABC transporter permease [Anaerolineales bacterium]